MAMAKLSKEQVNYREARPGSPRCCGTCTMFRPGWQGCTLVEGVISPGDDCDRYDKKPQTG